MILEALQIPSDIQANNDISKAEMHEQISRLDKLVLALTLGGDKTVESELVERFYEILQDNQRPNVVSMMKADHWAMPTQSQLKQLWWCTRFTDVSIQGLLMNQMTWIVQQNQNH